MATSPARSLRTNPFSNSAGILQRQTSGNSGNAETSDLFTHFSRNDTSDDAVHIFDASRATNTRADVNTSKRRTAPPVGSLSPERVETASMNDTSMLDLSNEVPRSQIDPFYRHAEDELVSSPLCVTVFGFPRQSLLSVLEDFSNIGKIERYHCDKYAGNWVHVQYTNHIQAKRAKEKHGDIVDGYMVGVVDCYNKEITQKALETTQSYIANCTHTVHDDDNSLNSSDQSRYSGIRNCSVLSPDVPRRRIIEPPTGPAVGTPTKNNGLLSRTVGYIFNW